MKEILQLLVIASLTLVCTANSDLPEGKRESKLLPVFQVVRFPNDPCTVTSGSKNGTCYTAEECSNKGGTNAGSCASGFGVCCTFTLNCGGESSENCTYFDSSTTVAQGACKAKICKCSTDICQIRLDFNSFVISGPSTSTISIGKALHGVLTGVAAGGTVAESGQCNTDTFSITNQNNLPSICGINSGYHVYMDARDECHDLNFQLGNVANGITSVATRSWSIKVTQYSCDYENLAPSGCDQYHFGSEGSNYLRTFNFQTGTGVGRHLSDQHQSICVRRESGMCRICYTVDTRTTDWGITGKTTGKIGTKGTACCAYGIPGDDGGATGGGDCVIIPGAVKAIGSAQVNQQFCGSKGGLGTAMGATSDAASMTICSKALPFRIEFNSDQFEITGAMLEATAAGSAGFKIRYYQTTC